MSKARHAGRSAAAALGLAPAACEEVALVMTELATNLLKHAGGGELHLREIAAEGRAGLEVESADCGPGIADVDLALTDRYSTAGSRGTGLGAVNRLMDELQITSNLRAGTRVLCRKWRRREVPSSRLCPLVVGVATRARANAATNGDAFVVRRWGESLLVGLIDGLGHGPFAHRAAQSALSYVNSHFDLPLGQIFLGTGRACRATRGVVMALARFDWGCGRMSFASIGNIEARVFPPSREYQFTIRRGVLGGNAPNVVVTEHPWRAKHVLVLHSDGVGTHWNWKDFPALDRDPVSDLAGIFLHRLAKEADDATVLIVRQEAP